MTATYDGLLKERLAMDYPNNIRTAREWFQKYKEYVEALQADENITDEKLQFYKRNFFALEVIANKYDEQRRLYPENHFDKKVDEVSWMLPVVEEIMNIFETEGDRYMYLDRITVSALETLVKLCNQEISSCGKGMLVPSVVASMDNIFTIAANDKSDRFNSVDGMIDVDRIVCEYPEEIIIIRELVTQKIFKNAIENDSFTHVYETGNKKGTKAVNVSLVNMSQDVATIERELSYYDWAVMEAIHALYKAGNEIVDLDSIEAVLKHRTHKGTSDSKKTKRDQTILFDSVNRLMKNYVTISDEKFGFDDSGYLVDGEIITSNGKFYLKLNSECILAKYACKKGQVNTYKLSDLELNISYTDNTIALYRYMIQCVTEIFGSPKTEDLVNGVKKLKPQNPKYDYISCKKAYEPILGKDAKNTSKQETLRKRMKAIFGEMKRLGFIDKDDNKCKYIDEKGNQHFKVSRSSSS